MPLVLSLPLSLTLSPAPFPLPCPQSPPCLAEPRLAHLWLFLPQSLRLFRSLALLHCPFFHKPLVRSLAPSLVTTTSEPPERPLNYFALPPDHPFSNLFLPGLFLSLMSLVLFPSSFPASHSPACPTVWLHVGYHLVTFPWPFFCPCLQPYH